MDYGLINKDEVNIPAHILSYLLQLIIFYYFLSGVS
jgi:hypothetical protein